MHTIAIRKLDRYEIFSKISFALETAKRRYQHKIDEKDQQLALEQDKVAEAKKYIKSIISAKREFLANMSHEFRTPLNHMIGFMELVVDQKFGKLNQIQREYLNDALQSSKYLFALINDILDFKRLAAVYPPFNDLHILRAFDKPTINTNFSDCAGTAKFLVIFHAVITCGVKPVGSGYR